MERCQAPEKPVIKGESPVLRGRGSPFEFAEGVEMGKNLENVKKEVLSTIISAAILYRDNLLNTKILFVFETGGRKYKILQTEFRSHHFAHLTGAVLTPPKSTSPPRPALTPIQFFEKATAHSLSIDDFWMAADNSTYLKSQVIIELMKIYTTAKMVGDYDESRPLLYTDKIVGNVRGCMGFVQQSTSSPYWVPNTLLNVPARDVVRSTHRLMATYQKRGKDILYSHMLQLAKPLKWQEVRWGDDIDSLIDLENLHFR